MNKLSIFALKTLRKVYQKVCGNNLQKPQCDCGPESVSMKIYNRLVADEPCMIARFGSTELNCLVNYLGIKQDKQHILRYIKGLEEPWWWEWNRIAQMQRWSGFFPPTIQHIERFCALMLQDAREADILGSWLAHEKQISECMDCDYVHLRLIEPFWASHPWTRALEGKKVLVVHPFSETIIQQYQKRDKLFHNSDCLPTFASLSVVKAVQTLGQSSAEFKNWFEALQWMKDEVDRRDYDICLIGAGAYGFPLAAHVKRRGNKAVHIGGALQLLFGIRGKRWEDPYYGVNEWGIPIGAYSNLMNEFWVRPMESEKPKAADNVEGGCYW